MKMNDIFYRMFTKKHFYDWMGMNENETFKEGATGDNFLAFHKVYDDILNEICRNVERMWEDLQENGLESTWDEWKDATKYAEEQIDKHCKADDDEKKAIFGALCYKIAHYDFNDLVDVVHKVEVNWWEDEIGIEIEQKTSFDIFAEWAHIKEDWNLKEGFSDENLNSYYEVENQLVGMVVDKINEMSQYDSEMEWEDCDKWLDDVIARECRANERERDAIFEVVMDYVCNQYPFEEAEGWIECDGDKTIIYRVNEEEEE